MLHEGVHAMEPVKEIGHASETASMHDSSSKAMHVHSSGSC